MKACKLLVLGCGTFGKKRIGALKKSSSAELAGIYDTSLGVANDCSNLFNAQVIQNFEDVEKLHFDGVIISTSNDSHLSLCQYFLKKEKYILCESPLVKNLEQLEEFRHYSPENLSKIKPATPIYYHPAIEALKNYLCDNDIGKIFLVKISLGHNHEATKFSWQTNHAISGGGVLMELGPTVLNLVDLFGKIHRYDVQSKKFNPSSEVDDYAYGHFELENQILVHFECDWNKWNNSETLIIESENCIIKVPLQGNSLIITDRAGDVTMVSFDPQKDPLAAEIESFATGIENKTSFLEEIKGQVFNLPTILRKAS